VCSSDLSNRGLTGSGNRWSAQRDAAAGSGLVSDNRPLRPPVRLLSLGPERIHRFEVAAHLVDQLTTTEIHCCLLDHFARSLADGANRPLTAVRAAKTVLQPIHGVPDPRPPGGGRRGASGRVAASALAVTARLSAAACERTGFERPTDRGALERQCAEDGAGIAAELHLAPAQGARARDDPARACRLRPACRSGAVRSRALRPPRGGGARSAGKAACRAVARRAVSV